jgi:hypothetical protein
MSMFGRDERPEPANYTPASPAEVAWQDRVADEIRAAREAMAPRTEAETICRILGVACTEEALLEMATAPGRRNMRHAQAEKALSSLVGPT